MAWAGYFSKHPISHRFLKIIPLKKIVTLQGYGAGYLESALTHSFCIFFSLMSMSCHALNMGGQVPAPGWVLMGGRILFLLGSRQTLALVFPSAGWAQGSLEGSMTYRARQGPVRRGPRFPEWLPLGPPVQAPGIRDLAAGTRPSGHTLLTCASN